MQLWQNVSLSVMWMPNHSKIQTKKALKGWWAKPHKIHNAILTVCVVLKQLSSEAHKSGCSPLIFHTDSTWCILSIGLATYRVACTVNATQIEYVILQGQMNTEFIFKGKGKKKCRRDSFCISRQICIDIHLLTHCSQWSVLSSAVPSLQVCMCWGWGQPHRPSRFPFCSWDALHFPQDGSAPCWTSLKRPLQGQ